MAEKRAKAAKTKRVNAAKNNIQYSPKLILIGLVSTMIATLSMICVPCLLATFPSLALFFAFLGVLAMLLARYSWVFLILGVLLLAIGLLLSLQRKNKCG